MSDQFLGFFLIKSRPVRGRVEMLHSMPHKNCGQQRIIKQRNVFHCQSPGEAIDSDAAEKDSDAMCRWTEAFAFRSQSSGGIALQSICPQVQGSARA